MKKLIIGIAMLCLVSVSFGASYRVDVVYNTQATYNPSDTNNVTPKQRIDACVRANCVKLTNGTLTKANLINGNQITDGQLEDWVLRGGIGSLTERLYWYFVKDPGYGPTISDTQLDTIFLHIVWPLAKMIGQGRF